MYKKGSLHSLCDAAEFRYPGEPASWKVQDWLVKLQ